MRAAHDVPSRWPALDVTTKQAHLKKTLRIFPGFLGEAFTAGVDDVDGMASRIWRREPGLWSADEAARRKIADRLGWLDSPALMAESVERLRTFAELVRHDGFTHVVLLGMGGSSLAPEVLRAVVGTAPGWPQLHMLDSTDPAAIRAVATPLEHTLFLLASKSGTTIEPNSLAAHFRAQLERSGLRWAEHFVAITDEGTALARRARDDRFRDVFINPSDIGGRYSAVSFFGLVPAALMGQDVSALVGWAVAMMIAAQEPGSKTANPAVALGSLIGTAAQAGRDKLTLILPPALEAFGLWVEQLIAESTGKNGTGIVPIAGETATSAPRYGDDRLFVRLGFSGSSPAETNETLVQELVALGKPVADIEISEPTALGAEFFRWEIATAIAGAMLRINPFDEPNVQQAKDATRVLLGQHQSTGQLSIPPSDRTLNDGGTLTLTAAARAALGGRGPESVLTLIGPADYFAILAYVGPARDLYDELQGFRNDVRDRTGASTTCAYGPRYLHSSGQLHKGGPNSGVFVLLSATAGEDLPIPGEPFSFGTLELAQALGDFASLDATGRRALHVHLPSQDARLVRDVAQALLKPLNSL